MDYVTDSEEASVTVVAVTSAAPGSNEESLDNDIKENREDTAYFLSPKRHMTKPATKNSIINVWILLYFILIL